MSASQAAAARGARRRIVFVNRYFSPDLSATSQLLTDLAVAIGSGPFEVHVLSSRLRYDEPRTLLPASGRIGEVQVHRCWSTRFGRDRLAGRMLDYLSFYLASLLYARRLARRDDILVALTDPPMLSVGLGLVAKLRGALLINWLQDVFPEIATALGAARLPGWLERALLRARNASLHAAVSNVVLGERMGARVQALGVAPERIAVIENWADGETIRPLEPDRSTLRASLPPGTAFVVQYSGNLGRAHDFHTILGAAQILSGEPGWLFLMVGGGANMVRLKAQVARLSLGNLQFLPYRAREQLGDSLAAADVHLSSLLPVMEGLIVPSKFYGVLAAGRPLIVIGDPQSEQARIVREEGCGDAIACGDPVGLAQLLRLLRADPQRCLEQGARARALFERRFTPAKAFEKWRLLLRSAGAAGGAAARGTCSR
jgi:glycosyltransferase involved in cell wall biosynthesis